MDKIVFLDRQSFIQAAFNEVARIVSEHGNACLEACVPAIPTERCLEQLALVASDWSYDYSVIDAYLDTYKKSNAEISEYLEGEC
jgi:hypothetical protein